MCSQPILIYLKKSVVLFHVILFRVMLFHVVLFRVMLFHVVLFHVMLFHVVLFHVVLFHVVLHHIMSRCTVSRYMLRHFWRIYDRSTMQIKVDAKQRIQRQQFPTVRHNYQKINYNYNKNKK